MINPQSTSKPKVCAVSYLNPLPLVWGMLRGPQREAVDLQFALPAECARRMREGSADIGLIPVGALLDQPLEIFRGTGIACRGPVRSILLVSKVPFEEIQSLALDSSSRSSVLLARIILAKRYGVEPELTVLPPDFPSMLDRADAFLMIGDPALRLEPAELRASGFHVADLGEVWVEMTGLPMVFAVWAGQVGSRTPELEQVFVDSWRFGASRIDDIVATEAAPRGVTPELAHHYLTENITFDLGDREYAGMNLYLQYAADLLKAASQSEETRTIAL